MFLYEKKIVYLSMFQDGVKTGSAGFVRISRDKDACTLDIHVKNTGIWDGSYGLFLTARSRQIQWGNVSVLGGCGDVKRSILIREGFAHFGEEEFAEEDLCGVLIHLDKGKWIAGQWRAFQETDRFEKESLIREELNVAAKEERDEKQEIHPEAVAENKWEQLQKTYKKIHPFGDERLFISIEPKDFVILQAPYHRLVNNSFLLHGFYNYRHTILGPDREIGKETGTCFYLGVPGTYFEREKMVAVMFGFEGFECAGAVEIGKFGYYMRRVEL